MTLRSLAASMLYFWLTTGVEGQGPGVPEATLKASAPQALQSAELHFTQDGSTLLVLRHFTNRSMPLVTAQDTATGRQLYQPILATDVYGLGEPRNGEEGISLLVSPKEDVFLTISDKAVRAWNLKKGKALSPLIDHSGSVSALFAKEGDTFLTMSLIGGKGRRSGVFCEFRYYHTQTGKPIGTPINGTAPGIDGPRPVLKSLLWMPDGKSFLASYSGNILEAKSVRLWDADSLKPSTDALAAEGDVHQLNPDGKMLLACSKKGIALWDVEKRERISELSTPKIAKGWVGREQRRINTMRWYAVLPAVSRVLLTDTKNVDLWDLKKNPPAKVMTLTNPEDVYWVTVSKDGKRAATAMGDRYSGQVLIWDLANGKPESKVPQFERLRAMEFSPDGRSLAIVDGGDVRIWNVEGKK